MITFWIIWGVIGLLLGLVVVRSSHFRDAWDRDYKTGPTDRSFPLWAAAVVVLMIIAWPLLIAITRPR